MAQAINLKTARLNWSAATYAGLLAGFVFIAMEMILVALAGEGSACGPPRMIAAIVMSEGILTPRMDCDLVIVLTGMAVHLLLSVLLSYVLCFFISKVDKGAALLAGLLFGFLVYIVNFYGIAPMAFPWFEMAQNWITLVSHLVFGLTLAWLYKAFEKQKPY